MRSAALARPEIVLPPETVDRARGQLFSLLAKGMSVDRPKLEQYFIDAWPIIEPATPLQNRWYIGYLAEHLEAVVLGQILRLAISIHPRSAKSNLVTILWPTQTWIEKSFLRWMFISYSQDLSTEHSLKRRRVIESRWYQERWGSLYQLRADQNRKNVFENTATGTMLATSQKGTATGKGANIQVYDDFINPQEAESEAERKSALEAYGNTFSSRLNDPKTDAMVVLAQRTHRDDLTGHVLKEGGWAHVELPVIAMQRTVYSYPLTNRQVVREVGDILNPARHDALTLEKQKRASGSRTYSAQWMCAPAKDEGSMCPKSWWHFYKDEPRALMNRSQAAAQSWDFAFKDLEGSSWVVGYVGGRIGGNIYVAHEKRDHMDFTKTCNAVVAMSNQWPMTSFKFYEDRANGPAIKSHLQKKVPGLIPVEPLGSKEARFAAASPNIESGNVLLPYPWDEEGKVLPDRQWVIDLMEEVEKFPEEPNDRGDALSQLIIKLMNVAFFSEDAESEIGGSIADMNGDGGPMEIDSMGRGFEDMLTGGFEDGTL